MRLLFLVFLPETTRQFSPTVFVNRYFENGAHLIKINHRASIS
jgi:hypothetical protein